jgi:cation transport ATPase
MSATEIPAAAPTTDAPVSPTRTVRLGIEGMHCASCVARVEQELERTAGVVDATVNLLGEEATVSYLPQTTDVAGVEDAVRRAGYKPRPAPAAGEDVVERQDRDREREYRMLMRKFWFAAVISVPVVGSRTRTCSGSLVGRSSRRARTRCGGCGARWGW